MTVRLGLSVEGASEREFVRRVLAPHLAGRGVLAVPVDMRGRISLDRLRPLLPRLLGSFDVVSTLYDFYGFERRPTPDVAALETAIAGLVDAPQRGRLLPYVQQYEFEALLFAVPEQTASWLEAPNHVAAAMHQVVRQCGGPEEINDSPQTSPSHRLLQWMPRYRKPLHGPQIIELVGLPIIRAQCPRFDAWVTRLEQLGRGPTA